MFDARMKWICVAVGALACGGGGDGPMEVAEAFWMASRDGDMELARSYVRPGGNASIKDGAESPVSDVTVEAAEVTGDSARVPTHVVGSAGQGTPLDVRFPTILVREDGQWLVDLDRTSGEMMRAMIGVSLEDLGKAMGDAVAEGMKEAMGAMAEGMAEGFREMGDSLRSATNR